MAAEESRWDCHLASSLVSLSVDAPDEGLDIDHVPRLQFSQFVPKVAIEIKHGIERERVQLSGSS
jgi:hypothetical protein